MTVLKNCRVIDVRDGTVRETDVAIERGRIHRIERTRRSSKSLDLQGAYLLPGLISCHTHLSIVFPFHERDAGESPAITALRCARRAKDILEGGITTVRTVAEMHRADIALRSMIDKGWAEGPRIFSAGKSITVTGGHGRGFGALQADSPDEFRKCVRQELEAGANHIKIFISGGIAQRGEAFDECQMTFEEMEAAVGAARSKGTYVCAHSSGAGPIQLAVKAGVRCFEHGYHIDKATAKAMHKANCYLVPTLCVTRSRQWMEAHGFEDWTVEKALSAGEDHLESIRTAVREGIQLVNGTDIPPGEKDGDVTVAIKEMGYMVEAGLTPLQSIQASTIRAAELVQASDQLGAIEPGYHADLIAVDRNPMEDIEALHHISFVMKAGRTQRWDRT